MRLPHFSLVAVYFLLGSLADPQSKAEGTVEPDALDKYLNQQIQFLGAGGQKVAYLYNYSQMKFVAIILVLSVFFNAIFRLAHLTFRPQKRTKQVAPSGRLVLLEPFSSLVSKYAIHRICFGDLWCEGWFLETAPPPHCCHPISPPMHPPPAALTSRPCN